MSALNAQYFAALSISSLASDDRSISIDGDGSYISHSAIYQQLSNIEDIATNFITRRPINLDFKHGVYSEVEYDSQQDFEFHVSTFSQHELISICIKCLPNFTVGEPVLLHPENDMKAGENHCALVFNIERKVGNRSVGERVPFKATLTNGEYTIILSNSSNVIPGTYLLSVCLADVSHYSNVQNKVCTDVHAVQAIRVHCKKTKTVRTIPLEAGVTVQGTANFSDMCYYRFVTGDPHHRITISVAPSANSAGDPDLYVTNQYNGQVGVTRENCVWSCVNLGVSRVDILPDDANLPENVTEGRIFVIGVASNGSEEADFLLTVTTSPPPLCTVFNFAPSTAPLDMAPPALPVKVNATGAESASGRRLLNCAERGCTLDLALVEGEYLHFAVQLPDTESLTSSPAASPSSIAVLVHDAPGLANIAHATVVQQVSVPALIASEQVNLHCGLGVHAGDTLAAQGLLSETPTHSNSNSNSSRNVSGLWPVVYASADVLFPDRESFTWRVSYSNPIRFSRRLLFMADVF